jgi:hypothetical protein
MNRTVGMVRVKQCASLRIISDGLSPAQISGALGVQPSGTARAADWVLEPAKGSSGTSLEEQIIAVVGPLLGVADKLSELVRSGAVVEFLLTRSLLGPGVGMLCFMLDSEPLSAMSR